MANFYEMLKNPDVGHNGGRPEAGLWFCGLEQNGGVICEQHNQNLIDGKADPMQQDWTTFNNFIWNILNNLGYNPSDESAEKMYNSTDFFCANLYPFACRNESDESNIEDLTGMSKKNYYYACDMQRHNSLQWHNFHKNANIIICFGIRQSFIWQFTINKSEYYDAMIQYWLAYAKTTCPKTITINLDAKTLLLCPHPRSGKISSEYIAEQINKITKEKRI